MEDSLCQPLPYLFPIICLVLPGNPKSLTLFAFSLTTSPTPSGPGIIQFDQMNTQNNLRNDIFISWLKIKVKVQFTRTALFNFLISRTRRHPITLNWWQNFAIYMTFWYLMVSIDTDDFIIWFLFAFNFNKNWNFWENTHKIFWNHVLKICFGLIFTLFIFRIWKCTYLKVLD